MERFLYVMIQDLDPPIHLQLGLGLGLGLGQDLYHPIRLYKRNRIEHLL